MFKEGDKYIHFTKYGGVNSGVVKSLTSVRVVDGVNGVIYVKDGIITDKGFLLELGGSDGSIYKVEKELSKEECDNLKVNFERLKQNRIKAENKLKSRIENYMK